MDRLNDPIEVLYDDGEKPRTITVPRSAAERWPEKYQPATTAAGRPTAAAKRAADATGTDDEPKAKRVRSTRKAGQGDASSSPNATGTVPAAGDPDVATATPDTTAEADAAAATTGGTPA